MNILYRPSLSPLRRFILASALLPLAVTFAEEVPKIPGVKVDPSPLPQTSGTVTTFAPVVEKVAPSVVTISTSKMVKAGAAGGGGSNPNEQLFRRFFGIPDDEEIPNPNQRRRGQGGGGGSGSGKEGRSQKQNIGLGSGVIVSAEGHVLTNNHVIEGADEILVTIGNEKHEYKAKKIGTDPGTDIAVLKIEATNLRPIVFADSDKLRVGDLAIAVGNPFGLTQSVTMGIISALGRGGTGITEYENFIQTDASINPGNSGGALVDTEGRLIGVNTAIFSRSGGNMGIGFAVPGNLVQSVMKSIITSGRVTRGYLGIGLDDVSEDIVKQLKLPSTEGAIVTQVEPGSPSDKAGLEAYDVVVAVNGKKIGGQRELRLFVASLAPGTKAEVKVLRDGKEKTISVTLAEKPNQKIAGNEPNDPKAEDPDVLDGVTVGDIDPESRKKFDIPESIRKGVVVLAIESDSTSAEAGIHVGDVILDIDRKPVANAKEAVEMSEKLKKEKRVLLRVATKGAVRLVSVEHKE